MSHGFQSSHRANLVVRGIVVDVRFGVDWLLLQLYSSMNLGTQCNVTEMYTLHKSSQSFGRTSMLYYALVGSAALQMFPVDFIERVRRTWNDACVFGSWSRELENMFIVTSPSAMMATGISVHQGSWTSILPATEKRTRRPHQKSTPLEEDGTYHSRLLTSWHMSVTSQTDKFCTTGVQELWNQSVF